LAKNEATLATVGVTLNAPQLLMEMRKLEWSMDQFLKKAGEVTPTLVLIRMKNGTECGGVAGVSWPKKCRMVADPAKGSFIFSLGATPARFDLVKPGAALFCNNQHFGFGPGEGGDLTVWSDGTGCGSRGQLAYAGRREVGQLIGATAEACYQWYERWELWRL
jgi:hypothetical protein